MADTGNETLSHAIDMSRHLESPGDRQLYESEHMNIRHYRWLNADSTELHVNLQILEGLQNHHLIFSLFFLPVPENFSMALLLITLEFQPFNRSCIFTKLSLIRDKTTNVVPVKF